MQRTVLITVLALTIATIAAAWGFQLIGGYQPCPLCYQQRWPYYVAIVLGLLLLAATSRGNSPALLRGGLVLLGLIMLVSAGLGIHHAGIEWQWWTGPAACSGDFTPRGGSLLPNLDRPSVVSCSEPQWRLFGLSFAGYNAVISTFIAALSLWGGFSRRA